MIGRVLLTGGARSGKSAAAESLLRDAPTTYVATGPDGSGDPEWQQRIAEHRGRRPRHWTTVTSTDLPYWIAAATPDRPVLVDCLTLWLTARMDAREAWDRPQLAEPLVSEEIDAVAEAVAACRGGLVVVTNEVGSGLVPTAAGSRLFRDLLGRCNARVAAQCDDVYLVVAGHVVRLQRLAGS